VNLDYFSKKKGKKSYAASNIEKEIFVHLFARTMNLTVKLFQNRKEFFILFFSPFYLLRGKVEGLYLRVLYDEVSSETRGRSKNSGLWEGERTRGKGKKMTPQKMY
jgi:hypothetical protein